jgi:hypothetical protein
VKLEIAEIVSGTIPYRKSDVPVGADTQNSIGYEDVYFGGNRHQRGSFSRGTWKNQRPISNRTSRIRACIMAHHSMIS